MPHSPSSLLLLIAIALYSSVEAFSPSFLPSQSVAQIVKDNQRFIPLSALDDDDDEEDDFGDIAPAAADDYIVNVGELESDEEDVGAEDDGQLPSWASSELRMTELRATHRRHEKDTGSPEFQIAGMTERVNYLTGHMKDHPKDYSTRRGLVALVNKRRRLLNYLCRENVERYKELIKSLGIRHKAPGRVPDRVEKYSRFPEQKDVKKHLLKK